MGVLARIFSNLVADDEPPDCLMIDSTHLKAHRTAASLQKGGMFPGVSGAWSGLWRTPFRRHDGHCSDAMTDTLAVGAENWRITWSRMKMGEQHLISPNNTQAIDFNLIFQGPLNQNIHQAEHQEPSRVWAARSV